MGRDITKLCLSGLFPLLFVVANHIIGEKEVVA